MCPIHNKLDVMMCDNYKAVTLLCTTYKILAHILYVKVVPYAEEIIGEYQGVFQWGRSTFNQTFVMRQILEKCWEQNIDVHHLYIDFQATYDPVWRMQMWSEMHKLGFPKN